MSHQTTPVSIYKGYWSESTRQHPIGAWMEQYTREFDRTRAYADPSAKPEEWMTDDFTVQMSDGKRIEGRSAAVAALVEKYAPFTGGHKHCPTELLVWREGEEWVMFGHARCYLGFEGVEKEVKDPEGDMWNVYLEAAYRFVYVEDASAKSGYKIKETRIYADPTPAVGLMLQKGLATAEQLGFA